MEHLLHRLYGVDAPASCYWPLEIIDVIIVIIWIQQ